MCVCVCVCVCVVCVGGGGNIAPTININYMYNDDNKYKNCGQCTDENDAVSTGIVGPSRTVY